MRARVADLLGLGIDQVSIKAKTPEGLNLDHVAQCHAVALVERVIEPEELKSMSAVIESQRQLEDVVEDLLSSVHGVPKKRGRRSTTPRTLRRRIGTIVKNREWLQCTRGEYGAEAIVHSSQCFPLRISRVWRYLGCESHLIPECSRMHYLSFFLQNQPDPEAVQRILMTIVLIVLIRSSFWLRLRWS